MIYILSGGNLNEAEKVEAYTFPEAFRWLMLKRYESYVMKESVKS